MVRSFLLLGWCCFHASSFGLVLFFQPLFGMVLFSLLFLWRGGASSPTVLWVVGLSPLCNSMTHIVPLRRRRERKAPPKMRREKHSTITQNEEGKTQHHLKEAVEGGTPKEGQVKTPRPHKERVGTHHHLPFGGGAFFLLNGSS